MLSIPKSKNTRSTSKQQEKSRLPLHDNQEIQTSYMLSSEFMIQRMQSELVYCEKPSQNKMKKIIFLERKLGNFDSNIVVLKFKLTLANYVSDMFHKRLDDQEQYSH